MKYKVSEGVEFLPKEGRLSSPPSDFAVKKVCEETGRKKG